MQHPACRAKATDHREYTHPFTFLGPDEDAQYQDHTLTDTGTTFPAPYRYIFTQSFSIEACRNDWENKLLKVRWMPDFLVPEESELVCFV